MLVLLVFALVWLGVRIITAMRTSCRAEDEAGHPPPHMADSARPQDAVVAVPQDAPYGPQDASAAHLDGAARRRPAVPEPPGDLTVAVAVCWTVVRAVREHVARRGAPSTGAVPVTGSPALAGQPSREWTASLRETIVTTTRRPEIGPACFGGRDDATYLRGWDDAVDWISQGQDAKAPTWGDIAYMTGWTDAVNAVANARRGTGAAIAA